MDHKHCIAKYFNVHPVIRQLCVVFDLITNLAYSRIYLINFITRHYSRVGFVCEGLPLVNIYCQLPNRAISFSDLLSRLSPVFISSFHSGAILAPYTLLYFSSIDEMFTKCSPCAASLCAGLTISSVRSGGSKSAQGSKSEAIMSIGGRLQLLARLRLSLRRLVGSSRADISCIAECVILGLA